MSDEGGWPLRFAVMGSVRRLGLTNPRVAKYLTVDDVESRDSVHDLINEVVASHIVVCANDIADPRLRDGPWRPGWRPFG